MVLILVKKQRMALSEDFKKALDRLEKQTNSIKVIEENISHTYLEEREISKMKREKIEFIYEYVEK